MKMDKYYPSADIIVFIFFFSLLSKLSRKDFILHLAKSDLSSRYIANFGSSKIFLKELVVVPILKKRFLNKKKFIRALAENAHTYILFLKLLSYI